MTYTFQTLGARVFLLFLSFFRLFLFLLLMVGRRWVFFLFLPLFLSNRYFWKCTYSRTPVTRTPRRLPFPLDFTPLFSHFYSDFPLTRTKFRFPWSKFHRNLPRQLEFWFLQLPTTAIPIASLVVQSVKPTVGPSSLQERGRDRLW